MDRKRYYINDCLSVNCRKRRTSKPVKGDIEEINSIRHYISIAHILVIVSLFLISFTKNSTRKAIVLRKEREHALKFTT